jgi:hypothetical protein
MDVAAAVVVGARAVQLPSTVMNPTAVADASTLNPNVSDWLDAAADGGFPACG